MTFRKPIVEIDLWEAIRRDKYSVFNFICVAFEPFKLGSVWKEIAKGTQLSNEPRSHACLFFRNLQSMLHNFYWKHQRRSVSGTGASQTKGFRPLLDVFFPRIYRIFRASHNANRWCIIDQMFAYSLPVDARVKNYR